MRKLLTDDTGASLIEWVLLVILAAVVAIAAFSIIGTEVSGMYSDIASATSQ